MACPAFPGAPALRRWRLERPWRKRRRMLPEKFAEESGVRPGRAREVFGLFVRKGIFRSAVRASGRVVSRFVAG